jgi:hypothetical protein
MRGAAGGHGDRAAEQEKTAMRTMLAGLAIAGLGATGAAAQAVPTEVTRLDGAEVTLYLHSFLSAEDRTLLSVIAGSPDAMAALLGDAGGHAAIAVAPAEGFVRNGVPADSATAIAQLPDAATARREALETCNAMRRQGPDCVLVLEVIPIR